MAHWHIISPAESKAQLDLAVFPPSHRFRCAVLQALSALNRQIDYNYQIIDSCGSA